MPSRKKLGGAGLILVVIFVLFMGASAKKGNEVMYTRLVNDTPKYGVQGPHPVGIRDMAIDGQAPLEITVWHPAVKDDDSDSPFLWGTHLTYEYVSSPRKVKIALNDAEHMIFTGPCQVIPWYLKFFSGEFCSDTDWDREYAHDLVNHFTTAFLLAELNQDVNAATMLAPNAVDSSGVTYEAQGY